MKFYCGIDLSARDCHVWDCHVCVIDEQLKIVVQQKLRNELAKICQLLAPYKANLKIVVESTFNWYWLIDGLQAEGFEVVLAHTLGLYLITGAKVKTDRRDAYSLAKLLLVGAVPAAYIYPVETRPVRDLLRRRMHFVHAVRCYPKVRRCYERQLKRHRGRGRQMISYNIIAHKLAQAAFHVLKEQTEYREELLFGR